MRTLVSILAAAALAALGFACVWSAVQTHQQARLIERLGAAQHELAAVVAEPQERIVELPEDGQEYHVSVIVHDDWRRRPEERRLVAWWSSDPYLASIKAQTHFHLYTLSDPIYQSRLAHAVDRLPAVLIQTAAGRVVVKLSGENIPPSAGPLVRLIVKLWKLHPLRPWLRPKPCPGPCPEPEPEPQPDVTPVEPIPDTLPPEPLAEFPWGWLVVAVLLGVLVPVLAHLKGAFRVDA